MLHLMDFIRFESLIYYTIDLAKPWNVLVPGRKKIVRFHFVKKGSCFICEANTNKPVLAEAGDIVFILSPGDHRLTSDSECNSEIYDSQFCFDDYLTKKNTKDRKIDTSLLCGQIKPSGHTTLLLFSSFPQVMHLKKNGMGEIQTLLSHCLSEVSSMDGTNEALAARIAETLLISLLEPYEGKLKALKYLQILQHIQAEYSKPIDWDEHIRKLGVSRPVFFKRFKALTGLTPNKYLNSVRMKKALVILESTDTPIKAIFHDVGFQTLASFSKSFKSFYGKSPSDIRKEK